ncbi:hypothetical protein H0H87_009038 [Tephrocybe sp. NHM501043]|nr:hypothetical protein H0H87_009038 [Tephrocybe sp. NHM501043]
MAAFSRIQLAAALLEYDNDLDNPDAPNRSAQESAIFLPFRQSALNRTRKNDYLGVPLAGDGGNTAKSLRSESAQGHQSRMSISTLHNPFGRDDHLEEEEDEREEELEVDLSSWGLDAFIPKDKAAKNGKGKQKATDPLSPHSVSSVPTHHPYTNHDTAATGPRRALGASRSMSVGGNLEYFGAEGERSISFKQMNDTRRRSFASPADTAGMETPDIMQRRRASSYSLLATQTTLNSFRPQNVPFPTTSARSGSLDPKEDGGFRHSSIGSRLDPNSIHGRTRSTASADARLMLDDAEDPENRQRTMSNATMATILLAEDNPFALRPPSRSSRFDPKAAAHARTMSNASMGSRMMLDQDGMSVHTSQVPDGQRRYSTTLDLLRPKVLVMPSPLQSTAPPPAPLNEKVRAGFELSTDGPPLPPGARSSRRASAAFLPMDTPPVVSNSFTPNPLASLSLSQMTFRNTLKIDGLRDSYVDTELPRATMDGEQAQFEAELEDLPVVAVVDVDETAKTSRPAGKLFGKSLIDDLEERKAKMKSKQRWVSNQYISHAVAEFSLSSVFTGDERPSMMARASSQRASTLIDPAALQMRPVSQHMNSFGASGSQPGLGRRNSANIKPLLNFDEDEKGPAKAPGTRLPQGRSVFGVDTLWERELVKLKEIEAQEKQDEEARKAREEAEEAKKSKKKSNQKDRSRTPQSIGPDNISPHIPAEPRVSIEPPVLPDIPRASRKPPPQVPDDASDSDDSDAASTAPKIQAADSNWHADSSDEEDGGPRRTTGTGPRFPNKQRPRHTEDDDADDIPLSRLRPSMLAPDSDDERPLSTLKQKKSGLLDINFDNLRRDDDDDEDNQPLGLRVSSLAPSMHANSQAGDDDDRPLAFHPEQQRRSQFQMMAAQQQQQQQFMMQAQMQNNMYFSPPPMMSSPFFGPPMMPMMVQPPIPIPSPPPMHDQAKFNRVDSWRRDVAVEGEP